MMDLWPGTLVAILLPWFTGSAWTYWLLSRGSHWHPAAVIGHGYLLGLFATTMIMRCFQWAGLQQSFWGTSLCLLLLGLLAIALLYLNPAKTRTKPAEHPLMAWQKVLITLLMALIALRYATIFQELLLRPLFPWDAWMNWAPKALVWFHHGELVPFRSQAEWLASPAEALVHIEGARNAWKYPVGVPLVQLWGMLAAGTSDHTVIYLPWALIILALGAALYGHLKLMGAPSILATTAAYALLNMPFVNVHSMLAGYADLWVTVAFGCAIYALGAWHYTGRWTYALLALIHAAFCMQLKTPGLIIGGIVVITLLISSLQFRMSTWLGLAATAAAIGLVVAFFGIDIEIPSAGRLAIDSKQITVPYIGEFEIAFHNVNQAMLQVLFKMINWNIHWYLLLLAAIALMTRREMAKGLATELVSLVITLLFLFFVYYFTERSEFALDFTQVNRALVYSIPVSVMLVFGLLLNWVRGVQEGADK
ncbi:hypothetical protein E2F43_18015 [Seongchinamella unica]|uniref:Glycosyltransferase RgtA/B/C/D-like domain-containing protein n=1 Tax=Seongchinamella unica TaxID=2547392 RepID=A0A4R5LN68_9GAMM|nr:hypothetical protein [Seongchinamella unica]TDG11610.1 hypothetical protein E2F43_18015 [Seongchinamella unica]